MEKLLQICQKLAFSLVLTAGACQVGAEEAAVYEGLIEPYALVSVGSPVEGIVERINVKRSTLVEKGEVLVQLESSVENSVVKRARVLAAVEGEIVLQKERLAHARRMHQRVEELFAAEAISAEKRDEATTEVSLGLARLQKAEENKALAKLDYDRARAILKQRTIKSPISGVVVERFVSPGELVDNQPLVTLAQMNPLIVEMILPAEMLRTITPGMQADIHPETDNETAYRATVSIVDRVIDPASGTFGVRLELPNPDYELPGGLKCSVRFIDSANISAKADKLAEKDIKTTSKS